MHWHGGEFHAAAKHRKLEGLCCNAQHLINTARFNGQLCIGYDELCVPF